MTVSSTSTKVQYAGDGVTTSFPIPFAYQAKSHIEVVLRTAAGVESTWVENTNYTLSVAGPSGMLTVVTPTPAAGETLTIRRKPPAKQETDYPEGGAFPAASHEDALDLRAMVEQYLDEQLTRALKFPVSDASALSAELPASALRLSKYLGFDSTGVPVALAAPANTTIVSGFGATLIVAGNAAAAIALLALGTAALEAIGTSGGTLGKLNANKTDSGTNTYTGVQHFTKAQIGDVAAALLSSAGVLPIDASLGNNFEHTLTENTTLGLPSNLVKGQWFAIALTQHASAAKTLAYNAKYKFVGSTPALTTVLSGKAQLVCYVAIATGGSEVIFTALTNFG